jgi:hypothetical protein
MTRKPPPWADVLLTIWIAAVGLIYFGGFFWPDVVGPWTEPASKFYALMLLVAVGVSAWRLLARSGSRDGGPGEAGDGPDHADNAAGNRPDAAAIATGDRPKAASAGDAEIPAGP